MLLFILPCGRAWKGFLRWFKSLFWWNDFLKCWFGYKFFVKSSPQRTKRKDCFLTRLYEQFKTAWRSHEFKQKREFVILSLWRSIHKFKVQICILKYGFFTFSQKAQNDKIRRHCVPFSQKQHDNYLFKRCDENSFQMALQLLFQTACEFFAVGGINEA